MNFDGEEILVHMSMSDDEEAGHGEQSMNCRVQCCCMVSVSDCLSTMLRHWSLYLSLATLKYSWTWITDRIRTTDHREADEKQIEFTGLNTCMELLKNQSAPMLRFLDLLGIDHVLWSNRWPPSMRAKRIITLAKVSRLEQKNYIRYSRHKLLVFGLSLDWELYLWSIDHVDGIR